MSYQIARRSMCQMPTELCFTVGSRPQPQRITERTTLIITNHAILVSFLSHNTWNIFNSNYLWKKRWTISQGFLFRLSSGVATSKLSVLWKSSKLIIQYSDAPQPAETTGLTSYRQGWLWSPNPLSGHYRSLSLIRLTDAGKNLCWICLETSWHQPGP